MEETLKYLGLNEKEARLYLYLLTIPPGTASQIAKGFRESRENVYILLQGLKKHGLLTADDTKKVKTFTATSPLQLKTLLAKQQETFKRHQRDLQRNLLRLDSTYRLKHSRPGVVYFEGLEGFSQYQEDIAAANTVDVIGSNVVPDYPEAWEILSDAVRKRYANGTVARLLLHHDAINWLDIPKYENERGFNVRFIGKSPYEADVVIYDTKVGLTAYDGSLITTVISNSTIANTFRDIFESLWACAELPK